MENRGMSAVVVVGMVMAVSVLAGCAKHADFIEVRDQLSTMSRSQEQDHQRVDAVLRRLESVERAKDVEAGKPRVDEIAARLQRIENRLAKLEETANQPVAKSDPMPSDFRLPKPVKPPEPVTTAPGITPTSAFNLAYNDYLNGKYELAVAGFQRFVKDFPGTSLAPNAQYWLGESYYNLKDYGRAIQTFDSLLAEYPGNEKAPAALYKLGLATAETGDLVKSKRSLKRVLEEFPASDESRLAKNKLAEFR
jgi:tol-pal system protein YbgF